MPRRSYEGRVEEALNLPDKAKAERARRLLASLEPLMETFPRLGNIGIPLGF